MRLFSYAFFYILSIFRLSQTERRAPRSRQRSTSTPLMPTKRGDDLCRSGLSFAAHIFIQSSVRIGHHIISPQKRRIGHHLSDVIQSIRLKNLVSLTVCSDAFCVAVVDVYSLIYPCLLDRNYLLYWNYSSISVGVSMNRSVRWYIQKRNLARVPNWAFVAHKPTAAA
jgi:hypothetical protein